MNTKMILCLAMLLSFHRLAYSSTNLTLFVKGNTNNLPAVTNFNVSAGQTAKILYVAPSAGSPGISYNGITILVDASANHLPVIVGPATITLDVSIQGPNYFSLCTIELSNPGETFVPSNAGVIPADSGGPVNIILESSSNLINWYPSLPGTYGANYTNRFFRVKAQLALS